jgi:hypothetical protein
MDFIHPEIPQLLRDKGRRLVAIELQFGMRMQMPAPACHFCGEIGDTVDDGHGMVLSLTWQ